jgi:hypothetical protein
MKSSLDIALLQQKITDSFNKILRYHLIVSIVVVALFLMYAVITVNMILNNTTDPEYVAQQQAKGLKTQFDDETITKINDLKRRQENTSIQLPDGRLNPFSE